MDTFQAVTEVRKPTIKEARHMTEDFYDQPQQQLCNCRLWVYPGVHKPYTDVLNS